MDRLTFWNGSAWAMMFRGQEVTGADVDQIAEYEKMLALCVNRQTLLEEIEKLDIAKHWKLLFQWVVEKQPAANKQPGKRQRVQWEAD